MFGSGGGGSDPGGSKALQQHLTDVSNARRKKQNDIINETAGPLSYFYGGKPQDSGLYKDYVTTGTESTARAYDDAKANVRQKGLLSGFGETSPTENAAEAGLSGEESKAMADVPNQALKSTIAPEMQALALRSGQAGYYGDAPAYAGDATHLSEFNTTRADQQSQAMQDAITKAMMAMMAGGA